MSLIKSISGIRGTIGGKAGEGLSPLDIVKFTTAYATFIRRNSDCKSNVIVVGRDARLSGRMVLNIVVGTLTGMGFDVVNIGLATTPTTELAVVGENACGGIIITASHNPKQWNALKLLNDKGEFLDDAQGKEVLRIAEAQDFGMENRIGECVTTMNCDPSFAHRSISTSRVSCRCGDNAASGSSIRYSPSLPAS